MCQILSLIKLAELAGKPGGYMRQFRRGILTFDIITYLTYYKEYQNEKSTVAFHLLPFTLHYLY